MIRTPQPCSGSQFTKANATRQQQQDGEHRLSANANRPTRKAYVHNIFEAKQEKPQGFSRSNDLTDGEDSSPGYQPRPMVARMYVLDSKFEHARHSVSIVWILLAFTIFFGIITWAMVGVFIAFGTRSLFGTYYCTENGCYYRY
ncbi:hypothetical protein C0Q70_18741 [Pomacea canaliculata]|uniref:Uncharacterized protein n=1 Tax=Pomacea canaliculata TaxID=400727 RepID=A0A2T7NHF4_POMCA|nr:hypothetical protein C0Q70_18741 [Pomacea canaliculata]